MKYGIFVWIYYYLPFWAIAVIVIFSIVLLGSIGRYCCSDLYVRRKKKHVFRIICFAFLIIYLSFVLWYTVFMRNPGTERHANLFIFSRMNFKSKPVAEEVFRGYVMNALLFFPIGLFISWLLKGSNKKIIIKTAVFSFLLSSVIEITQYAFFLGTAELDDIFFNTFGAAVGSHTILMQKTNRL